MPGSDLSGIYVLRNIDDALALRAALMPSSRLLIVGGGFIGLEIAASARSLGAAVTVAERHRCGLPIDPATTMGCLISKAQFDKTMGFIESAHAQGARLVCGGSRPADPALARGWFVEATVFADVTASMRLFQEEVFGPVLAVIPWDSEDELLEQVNALEYGLTASIWTRDLVRAHRLAARVESGYVWINHASSHLLGAEFGGYKRSGLGREEGLSELLAWTQTKNVYVSLG